MAEVEADRCDEGGEGLEERPSTSSRPSKRPTSLDEISSASFVPTALEAAMDDIDEFQMYQRFRLRMVSTFGSVASALYEFGADPESGRISREQFEDVCANKLCILTPREANVLFTHFTNADPMNHGVGGFATHRNFAISDEEWRFTVLGRQGQQGKRFSTLPFSSGPSGTSAGIYHRQIRMENADAFAKGSISNSKLTETLSTPRYGGSSSSGLSASNRFWAADGLAKTSKRSRIYPWRQPQQPWAPSAFAGQNFPAEVKLTSRFRPCEQTFKTAGHVSLDQPSTFRADPCMRKGEGALQAFSCPTRRAEMQPTLCAKQVQDWWPYSGSPPKPRLHLSPRVQISSPRV